MKSTLKVSVIDDRLRELYEVLESDDDRIVVGAILSEAALLYYGYTLLEYQDKDIAIVSKR